MEKEIKKIEKLEGFSFQGNTDELIQTMGRIVVELMLKTNELIDEVNKRK